MKRSLQIQVYGEFNQWRRPLFVVVVFFRGITMLPEYLCIHAFFGDGKLAKFIASECVIVRYYGFGHKHTPSTLCTIAYFSFSTRIQWEHFSTITHSWAIPTVLLYPQLSLSRTHIQDKLFNIIA